MPQAQAPAPQIPVTINQEQSQSQQQNGNFTNGYSPISTDNNTTNSTSNSENEIRQTGSISNFNVQNNNNSYFKFSSGTQTPVVDSLVLNAQTDLDGSTVATISYVHNFGGKYKKMAEEEIKTYNLGAKASLCTSIVKEGIVIDYSLLPEFQFCSAFTKVTEVAAVPSNEAGLLKVQLQEQIALLKQQQQTIEALQLRLIQMQNVPSVVRSDA